MEHTRRCISASRHHRRRMFPCRDGCTFERLADIFSVGCRCHLYICLWSEGICKLSQLRYKRPELIPLPGPRKPVKAGARLLVLSTTRLLDACPIESWIDSFAAYARDAIWRKNAWKRLGITRTVSTGMTSSQNITARRMRYSR